MLCTYAGAKYNHGVYTLLLRPCPILADVLVVTVSDIIIKLVCCYIYAIIKTCT